MWEGMDRMTEINPTDEDEVFYQAKHKTAGIWQSCSKEDYTDFTKMPWMDVRVLWTTRSVLSKISTAYKQIKEKHTTAFELLKIENEKLKKEVTHWKANHADLKQRLYVATHRTDLPSDRFPLFDKMNAEIQKLRQDSIRINDLEDALHQSQNAVRDGLTNEVELTRGIRKAKCIIEDLLELVDTPPDINCSCHILPPCDDCVLHTRTREVIHDANSFFSEGW